MLNFLYQYKNFKMYFSLRQLAKEFLFTNMLRTKRRSRHTALSGQRSSMKTTTRSHRQFTSSRRLLLFKTELSLILQFQSSGESSIHSVGCFPYYLLLLLKVHVRSMQAAYVLLPSLLVSLINVQKILQSFKTHLLLSLTKSRPLINLMCLTMIIDQFIIYI